MKYEQITMFDGENKFINNKPIRLISLFAGYDSQFLALKYLGIPFEHYRISEWAVKSIQANKDITAPNDNTDYSKDLSTSQIKQWLYNRISSDYNTPMNEQQINRLSEHKVRTIYNNMQATHNLGSITKITATDLNIVDTDKFTYIMTYSFPCQDLSLAGQRKGMSKGNGTRSGLLWEVERLLIELNKSKSLPTILLLENVPQVHGTKNKQDFNNWCNFLESLGYKNYWQDLNAKDYGIPQNRNRCFMISILGDYFYIFPKPMKHCNHDWIDTITKHYYFTEQYLIKIENWKTFEKPLNDIKHYGDIIPTLVARGQIANASMVIFEDENGKRNLSPIECFRLMGVKNEDFENVSKNQSMSSLFHLAGDSIVTTCLMSIFGELFDIDYNKKINELIGELKQ